MTTTLNHDDSQFDPIQFLEQARQKADEKLKLQCDNSNQNIKHDLHFLLRSTNDLITTNEEIWARCKADRCTIQNNDPLLLVFSRHSFKVRCKTYDNDVSITVQPEVIWKDFGPPPTMPSDLMILSTLGQSKILLDNSSLTEKFEQFPEEFRLLLQEQAGLLNEAALIPFLLKMKDHLESLHVYLGTIESWLLMESCHAQFLKDLTGLEVSIPKEKTLIWCDGAECSAEHPQWSRCSSCCKPLKDHTKRRRRGAYSKHYCPPPTYNKERASQQIGQFQHYPGGAVQTLLCVPFWHEVYVSEISLDSDADQQKFKALHAYITTCVHLDQEVIEVRQPINHHSQSCDAL